MLTVRPMQLEDIDAVFAIEVKAHKTPWSRGVLSDCVSVAYDCRVLEQTENAEKRIVGYIISRINLNICHILNLCIATTSQHQGFGKFLLKHLLDVYKKSSVKTLILEVRPSNQIAIALYESFGFQPSEIKEAYYKDEHGIEDGLVLKKLL